MECSIATDWTINESCLRKIGQSDYIQHKFIESTIPETEFTLQIYPNGNDSFGNGVYFYLLVKKLNKIFVKFTITIPSAKISKTIAASNSKKFGGFLCSRSIFFNPKYNFLMNGNFYIQLCGTLKNVGKKRKDPFENLQASFRNVTEFVIEVHESSDNLPLKTVHQIVLKKYLDIFENFFFEGENDRSKFKIEGFSYNIVMKAIEFCYNSSIQNVINENEALSLLKFADVYRLQSLKEEMEYYFFDKITPQNVCFYANISVDSNAVNLRSHCMNILIKCIKESIAVKDSETLKDSFKNELLQKCFCISL
uniref:BTB domain-containing protein n=1 Tax=Panagrolaimus davidi TaxID=227884 RepID=A0A914PMX0_9BILA